MCEMINKFDHAICRRSLDLEKSRVVFFFHKEIRWLGNKDKTERKQRYSPRWTKYIRPGSYQKL